MSYSSSDSKLPESVLFHPPHKQTWAIEDYSGSGYTWKSGTFYNVHSLTRHRVEMVLLSNNIDLTLYHHACKDEKVTVSYDFIIHDDAQNFKERISVKSFTFSGKTTQKKLNSRPFPLEHKGSSFKLQLSIIEVIDKNSIKYQYLSLNSDIYRTWAERKFCDFVISVEGKDIPVHRLILAGASPVFEAMLQHDMIEKSTARVVIKDYKVDVFERLLQFIYTRKSPDFESFSFDICLDILRAANQYDLTILRSIISRYLISILSMENVAEILIVAGQTNVEDLKENAIDFIWDNGNELIKKGYLNKIEEKELWKEIALTELRK